MESFLDMGGYAAFIWPAFGLTFVVMAGMVVFTLRSLRTRQRELARLEGAGARRARHAGADTGSESGSESGAKSGAKSGSDTGNHTGGEQRGVEA